ncbi:NADH:ubiquinone oxidoreductase chain I-like protein [Rivularia sp. PCC 7116]|uniref:NIL domain-containing protein n=1 Tax=Rivularia sp. PCC 7116 TaxID=373994 RepID=UPI00029EF1AE|nr:NIL domain-containing protein [Rivularia sp. PCC 7116]AFY54809.1 NADH:ubiquinone oxidoreductase chain I-like protein [Rivularia sp. PCC 7116]
MKKRVTITFPKRTVQMPITYRLAKDFNVAANIIRAQVAPNQIGKLVVELSGDIDQLDAAIQWMREQNIAVSLSLGEIVIDEESCVHCGLCTGVCPTQALTLNPQSFKLTFTRSRCIVCEQCIPTCPVNAISTNL